ncbi:MAG: ABC transporter ATP-binding protein [Candidatus Asgardarchaeia archaeon]
MLKVENLTVAVGEKRVLKNVNLSVEKREVVALLGPNASGKSSLIKTIMGFPEYKVLSGKILFDGKDITTLPIEERVKLGLAIGFQDPPEVKNVKLRKLLEVMGNKKPEELIDIIGFHKSILERDINVGFSGGEKKVSEVIQIMTLNPKFVIFDELDSGLDAQLLYKIVNILRNWIINNEKSGIFVTHRIDFLNMLKPNYAYVLIQGQIVCKGDYQQIWNWIKKCGFNINKCPLAKACVEKEKIKS